MSIRSRTADASRGSKRIAIPASLIRSQIAGEWSRYFRSSDPQLEKSYRALGTNVVERTQAASVTEDTSLKSVTFDEAKLLAVSKDGLEYLDDQGCSPPLEVFGSCSVVIPARDQAGLMFAFRRKMFWGS